MTELKETCTLDEMLKLYAFYQMDLDIEAKNNSDLEKKNKCKRG
jgi:acyl-CoA-binding protein